MSKITRNIIHRFLPAIMTNLPAIFGIAGKSHVYLRVLIFSLVWHWKQLFHLKYERYIEFEVLYGFHAARTYTTNVFVTLTFFCPSKVKSLAHHRIFTSTEYFRKKSKARNLGKTNLELPNVYSFARGQICLSTLYVEGKCKMTFSTQYFFFSTYNK